MDDVFLWWSIISTVLGVIFLVGNVAQFVSNSKEKELHKSQVNVWQHHANGISLGLYVASIGKFSSVEDVRETIRALTQNAQSLFTSLNEERLFTDKEIKAKQLAAEEESKRRLTQVGVTPPTPGKSP